MRSGKIPGRGDLVEQKLPRAISSSPRVLHTENTIKFGALGAILMYLLPFGFRAALITSVITGIFVLSIVLITGFLGSSRHLFSSR